jgi:dTDP-4-dehydrorhamnose reductase/UDP-glucose 4-epimerase
VAPCLILGRGFIATAVAAALPPGTLVVLPHDAVRANDLPPGIDAVLWGGRHPALGTPDWRLEDELELDAARLAAARGLPFLSLGTRKVYAPSGKPLREDMPVGPTDRYGEQKLAIETALSDILGERLTRLRLANLFGYEPGRTTFAGRMLATLTTAGEIRFDMSPFTRRDFLPVEAAGRAIAALVRRPPGGIVNVGSGEALECGRLALWLLEGFGRGRLVCERWEERDVFVLDVRRLRELTGLGCTLADLRHACLAVGRLAARSG